METPGIANCTEPMLHHTYHCRRDQLACRQDNQQHPPPHSMPIIVLPWDLGSHKGKGETTSKPPARRVKLTRNTLGGSH